MTSLHSNCSTAYQLKAWVKRVVCRQSLGGVVSPVTWGCIASQKGCVFIDGAFKIKNSTPCPLFFSFISTTFFKKKFFSFLKKRGFIKITNPHHREKNSFLQPLHLTCLSVYMYWCVCVAPGGGETKIAGGYLL